MEIPSLGRWLTSVALRTAAAARPRGARTCCSPTIPMGHQRRAIGQQAAHFVADPRAEFQAALAVQMRQIDKPAVLHGLSEIQYRRLIPRKTTAQLPLEYL